MPAIKRIERKREGSRMEMRTFIRIRSHCMNCTVTYNTPLMYTNSVYFYTVCKIKNKTFDAGPANFFNFWHGECYTVQQKYAIKLHHHI